MNETHSIKEMITHFISDDLLGGSSVSENCSLFENRLLDSMNLAELIGFLESKFQVRIFPSEVALENLDTIERICEFLKKKQAGNS